MSLSPAPMYLGLSLDEQRYLSPVGILFRIAFWSFILIYIIAVYLCVRLVVILLYRLCRWVVVSLRGIARRSEEIRRHSGDREGDG